MIFPSPSKCERELFSSCQGHLFALCVHELLVEELLREGYIQDDDYKDTIHSELFSSKGDENNNILNSLIGKENI
jgi:hypothetical protein